MNKNSVKLYIDTVDSQLTVVEISRVGFKHKYEEKTNPTSKSQNVLPLIETALKTERLAWVDVTAIEINPGPGSFTGVRVGVAVANALGWALGVPVNGKKLEVPKYQQSKFD